MLGVIGTGAVEACGAGAVVGAAVGGIVEVLGTDAGAAFLRAPKANITTGAIATIYFQDFLTH